MNLQELVEEFRENMDLFDADASRKMMSQGYINRVIIKIEDLI